MRDIQLFNTALLAKQAWRIISNPDSLLARVLNGKYCHKKAFLKVEPAKSCSHGWRGIIAGRDLLLLKLGSVIGDGEQIKIWGYRWLSTDVLMAPLGPAPEAFQDLVVADLLCRESKEWNLQLIKKILPNHIEQIRALKPSLTGGRDGVAWLGSRSGIYSTKSGYFAAAEVDHLRTVHQPLSGWKSLLWPGLISPKLQFFLWKITQGELPVGDNLLRRGLLQHTQCFRCGELETVDHLFLKCGFAKQVWSESIFSPRFDHELCNDFVEALKTTKEALILPPLGISSDIFAWICWGLWTARNKLVFEGWEVTPQETLCKAICSSREWNLEQPLPISKGSPANRVLSSPDLEALILCLSDAAWKQDTNTAGFVCIYKDREGRTVHQSSSAERFVSSPL